MIGVLQATKAGYIVCKSGGVADLSYPTSKLRRGRVQGGGNVAPTITCNPCICKLDEDCSGAITVRKLSVRELGRLQGYQDADIGKMMEVNSTRQVIKQIGNSIPVTVLMAIFSQLDIRGCKKWEDMTREEKTKIIDKTRDWMR